MLFRSYAVGTGYIADTPSMRLWNHGDMETISSVRAPIFYDYNDTSYYDDPNGTSNFNKVYVPGQRLHHIYLSSYSYDTTAHYYWNRIANLPGEAYLQIEIMSKTDANYIPFVYAIASFSTWNSSTFSIKLDVLNSYDIDLKICFDNSNNAWIWSNAIWHSYFKFRVINNDGATVYESGITTQEATPTGVVCLPGQQARGTQGSASGTSAATSPANRFGALYLLGTGEAAGDFRAPIFYDSNDTNYYVDPSSTSILNAVVMYNMRPYVNRWHTSSTDNQTRFYFGNGGRTYFGSADGYEWRSSSDGNIGILDNGGIFYNYASVKIGRAHV